jgi:hypothetical protein
MRTALALLRTAFLLLGGVNLFEVIGAARPDKQLGAVFFAALFFAVALVCWAFAMRGTAGVRARRCPRVAGGMRDGRACVDTATGRCPSYRMTASGRRDPAHSAGGGAIVTRRNVMPRLSSLLLLAILSSGPLIASAQIRYKDAEGVTHWVDSLEMVPEPYRAGAVGRPTSPPAQPSEADTQAEARRLLLQKLTEWERAVSDCTEQVRADTSNPDFATFAATRIGPGQLRLAGSEPAQAAFTQCMRDAGQPMSRTTP